MLGGCFVTALVCLPRNIKWSDIQFDQGPGPIGKTNYFAYGGTMVNGLLYIDSFASSGGTDWTAFAKGMGTVLGTVIDAIPEVGPILSAALTGLMAIFTGGGGSLQDLFFRFRCLCNNCCVGEILGCHVLWDSWRRAAF